MENELSNDEFLAVKKFADDLKGCYLSRKTDIENNLKNNEDTLIEEVSLNMLNYVLSTLDIHLKLAEIKFSRYTYRHAKSFEKEIA